MSGFSGGSYYVKIHNRQIGPFPVAKFQELIEQGKVTKESQVSADGMTWKKAGRIPELFPVDLSATAAPTMKMGGSGSWYYAVDGKNRGPLSSEDMAELVRDGTISGTDLVWREGMSQWLQLRLVPELSMLIPQRTTRSIAKKSDGDFEEVSSGLSIGIAILSFLFPIIGLIVGIIFLTNENPSKKAAGKLWLTVAGVSFGLSIVCCCGFYMFAALAGAAAA